jgi:hypothetical protein
MKDEWRTQQSHDHPSPPPRRAASGRRCLQSPIPLLAQGGLTPPGAPAPTFKTLTQVEPRTGEPAENTFDERAVLANG